MSVACELRELRWRPSVLSIVGFSYYKNVGKFNYHLLSFIFFPENESETLLEMPSRAFENTGKTLGGRGFAPNPARGAYSAPQTTAGGRGLAAPLQKPTPASKGTSTANIC